MSLYPIRLQRMTRHGLSRVHAAAFVWHGCTVAMVQTACGRQVIDAFVEVDDDVTCKPCRATLDTLDRLEVGQ